ncbi:hypothetical protein H707_00179 [Bartonella bacilliformis Hosp800-02]|nr:hypothetical protein H707_00179 [Bartonella bacilliformis Hosp800-02]
MAEYRGRGRLEGWPEVALGGVDPW